MRQRKKKACKRVKISGTLIFFTKEGKTMMHEEFEKISGCTIDYKQYSEIIEPMYMALEMDKHTFCEMIKPTAKKMEKEARVRREQEAAKKLYRFRVVYGVTAYGYSYFEAETKTVIGKSIDWTHGTYERGCLQSCWWASWGYKNKVKENKDGTFTLKLENASID